MIKEKRIEFWLKMFTALKARFPGIFLLMSCEVQLSNFFLYFCYSAQKPFHQLFHHPLIRFLRKNLNRVLCFSASRERANNVNKRLFCTKIIGSAPDSWHLFVNLSRSGLLKRGAYFGSSKCQRTTTFFLRWFLNATIERTEKWGSRLLVRATAICRRWWPYERGVALPWTFQAEVSKGAITSKIKRALKHKTSPARLAQLLQPSLTFCFSLQPMTAYRPVLVVAFSPRLLG